MSKLNNEEKVKEALKIEDWSELANKDKFMEYLKLSKVIDKDTTNKLINTIPNYVSSLNKCIDTLHSSIKSKGETTKTTLNVLNSISDNLSIISKKENLSNEDMIYISEKLISVAEIVNDIHKRDNKATKEQNRTIGAIAFSIVAIIVLVASGGNIKLKG